jgi:hypothetical protein
MTLKYVVGIVCLSALAAFGTGCGASCKSLCEDGK